MELEEKAVRPLNTGFDITKARNVLGYSPTSIFDGLTQVKDQMKR
jgi:hypothetical protein